MQYAVVIEREGDSFGAYVPDLPGCIAVGESEEEVRILIREAIAFHLDGMREDGDPILPPCAHVEYVVIATAA
ncbi:MAG: type II toxin-antitoxin system HicB family antitoxin [Rubricoccaceae bacterium]|nr:type II toxin-antitoxin system HicB family antitoxin [Rubricoccaceae bacterium]